MFPQDRAFDTVKQSHVFASETKQHSSIYFLFSLHALTSYSNGRQNIPAGLTL